MCNKILILLFFFSSLVIYSQVNESRISQVGDENSILAEQFGCHNILNISQIGDLSNTVIEQDGIGNYYVYRDFGSNENRFDLSSSTTFSANSILSSENKNNIINVMQNGQANGAVIFNSGNNNSTDLTQNGVLNSYNLQYFGNNNVLDISQLGEKNIIVHEVLTSNADIQISQEGNNNTLINIETNSLGRNLIISQEGSGMRAIIINGVTR